MQDSKEHLTNLEFQIAFGAVRHFGRNLYTTNPPAIAELVANSWDAYAKKCDLCYTDKSLIIVDNGIGMNDEEFQNRYATSGKTKDTNIRKPNDMQTRPYMGKKGIGKFSAFSLADEYILYTKSNTDESWKKIILNKHLLEIDEAKVNIPVEYVDSLDDIHQEFQYDFDDIVTGTIIYFPKLKREITKSTLDSLSKLLSQRFSITTILNDGRFEVSIFNDNTRINIDFSKHFFYEKIENVHYFGLEKNWVKAIFPNAPDKYLVKEDNFSKNISGWIASVEFPADLKVSDEVAIRGISIYVNGKLVDEDILRNSKKDRIADAYIIGEVNANYIADLDEDVVLSSREGLFLDAPEVCELRDYLENIKKNIVASWDDMRADRDLSKQEYIARIIEKPENKKYYERLNEPLQKRFNKYAQRLFDQPGINIEKQEKLADLLFSALIQIVNNEEFQKLIEQKTIDDDKLFEYISAIFNLNEINHSLRLRDSVKSKLAVVAKLKEYMDKEEIESAFEELLATNPWLICPHWENHKTILTQQWYTYLNIDNSNPNRVRTDIILEVSDERLPIIVELKREKKTQYSAPDADEVVSQIYKYRTAISQKVQEVKSELCNANDVKAYFICGTQALKHLQDNPSALTHLKNNHIDVMSYEMMILTAERLLEVMYGTDLTDL